MQLLEDHIRREGKVAPGNVLRVDGFLNHQIDVVLLTKLAEEFHTRFSGEKVDKILTIEASGIAIGCLVAQQFGVPLVFAKKSRSSNLPADVYATAVHSYTHGNVNQVVVSREYLHSGERVLLIDDFLAHGRALFLWYSRRAALSSVPASSSKRPSRMAATAFDGRASGWKAWPVSLR